MNSFQVSGMSFSYFTSVKMTFNSRASKCKNRIRLFQIESCSCTFFFISNCTCTYHVSCLISFPCGTSYRARNKEWALGCVQSLKNGLYLDWLNSFVLFFNWLWLSGSFLILNMFCKPIFLGPVNPVTLLVLVQAPQGPPFSPAAKPCLVNHGSFCIW